MGMDESYNEKTLIIIKPDGVKRKLIGEIISRFERKGLDLLAIKNMDPSASLINEHYIHLPEKIRVKVKKYMSDTVIVMIWRGKDSVKAARQIVGATNPLEGQIGSIRADYCLSIGRNLVHASDKPENALREIKMWYPEFIEPEIKE